MALEGVEVVDVALEEAEALAVAEVVALEVASEEVDSSRRGKLRTRSRSLPRTTELRPFFFRSVKSFKT